MASRTISTIIESRTEATEGFFAVDQSLDAGFKPCFTKDGKTSAISVNHSVNTVASARAFLLLPSPIALALVVVLAEIFRGGAACGSSVGPLERRTVHP